MTNFFFFGANFSLDFLFHMFFLVRYCSAHWRRAPSGGGRRTSSSSSYSGPALMTLHSPTGLTALPGLLPHIHDGVHLGTGGTRSVSRPSRDTEGRPSLRCALRPPLPSDVVWCWCVVVTLAGVVRLLGSSFSARMNFLGLFTFTAPYLPSASLYASTNATAEMGRECIGARTLTAFPSAAVRPSSCALCFAALCGAGRWVLLSFSFLLGNNGLVDVVGICVGHLYYFLEDVYPLMLPSQEAPPADAVTC